MQTSSAEAATIAVLTYRRLDGLRALLPQLIGQSQSADHPTEILVVDNDPDRGAEELVATFVDRRVRYVHEPVPGITAGRNRALDTAQTRLLIFIDDDELPADGWLESILRQWRTSEPCGVVGPVSSRFSGAPDPWIVAGQFFQRPQLPSGTEVRVAASSNLLLDLQQVSRLGLRFDQRFGLTGGSDNLFTRQLTARGGRLLWCAEAGVVDVVPLSRMTRKWVVHRSYRMGNGTALVEVVLADTSLKRVKARARCVSTGLTRVAAGTVRVALGVAFRSLRQRANGVRNLARGAGLITGAFGFEFAEYQRSSKSGPGGVK